MDRRLKKELEIQIFEYYSKEKKQNEKWKNVVEKLISWNKNTIYEKLIIERYKKRKKEADLCMNLCIEKTTLYNYINEIFSIMLFIAFEKRLVDLDETKRQIRIV